MVESEDPKTPQWESTDVPGLLRRIDSGMYYGRFRVSGKRKAYPLGTDKKTIAKLRFHKKAAEVEHQRNALQATGGTLTMGELLTLFKARYTDNSNLSAGTKKAKGDHVMRIEKTWPEVLEKSPDAVSAQDIVDWANRLHSQDKFKIPGTKSMRSYSPESVNKAVATLRSVFKIAVERGAVLISPFDRDPDMEKKVRKSPVKKLIKLPARAEMEAVFAAIRKPKADVSVQQSGLHRHLAESALNVSEFLEGLAYSGMRLREAGKSTFRDFGPAEFMVHGTKTATSVRLVPVNPKLKALLETIKARRNPKPDDPVFLVKEGEKSLRKACKEAGVPRLRHHDLRHYFATVCIESGVDIPTVSKWLGHSDGGALAMRTYGHIRNDHSISMAQKVAF